MNLVTRAFKIGRCPGKTGISIVSPQGMTFHFFLISQPVDREES